jgi:acyl-coenzyme A thioesterase PaaI-like protein
MSAAANSLGYVGLPLNCEIHFIKGADPNVEVMAAARVVDTQGRIARVLVELTQGGNEVARVTEMVFLRSSAKA